MFNFEDLEEGQSVETILPNWKFLMSQLDGQKTKYEEQELEAGLGPEPTRTSNSPGEEEMYQIKKQSRYSYGATVVKEKSKGLQVLSVLDADGNEADEYRTIWRANQMDRKLEIFKQDYITGGAGFWEMSLENGKEVYKVKSPKRTTVFSADPVNEIWGDCAIETFKNSGVSYFRYSDPLYILTFKKSKDGYVLEIKEEHGLGKTPIIATYKNVTSDGVVTGDIELLKGVFDTMRQRINSTSQAAYWAGTRDLIIEGLDLEELGFDTITGESYNVAERLMSNIRQTDGGITLIPTGGNAGVTPTLKQTEEANLGQLVSTKEDTLRDLAALSGIPLHVFSGDKTPSTGEASVQAHLSMADDKKQDKANIGAILELMLSQAVFANTGVWKEFTVLWAVTEQVSINSLADTVSKLAASGIPLTWIVKNVLAGYRPTQINELLTSLEEKESMMKETMSMLEEGL